MTPVASVRRALRALAALPSPRSLALVVALTLALILPAAAGHALIPSATAQRDYDITFDITINTDDTYAMTMVFVDRLSTPRITEQQCTVEVIASGGAPLSNGKADFTEADGVRTCTITGSEPISETNGLITHTDGEYVVDTNDLPDSDNVEMSLSITFPGEITEADGGSVTGRTVTFDSLTGHVVRGEDSPGGLPWLWIVLVVVGALVLIGAIAAVLLLRRRKPGATPQAPYQPGPGEPGAPQPGLPVEAGQFSAPAQAAQSFPQAGAAPHYQQPAEQPFTGQQPAGQPGQEAAPAWPGSPQTSDWAASQAPAGEVAPPLATNEPAQPQPYDSAIPPVTPAQAPQQAQQPAQPYDPSRFQQ